MRDSGVSYAIHEYPLVERRMTRGDCLLWLEQHGYPRPPKSACIGCPYQEAMDRMRHDAQFFFDWTDSTLDTQA